MRYWAPSTMRIIELDAANWKTVIDFYHALLAAIGAPAWHGMSPDALIDSMIWGGINTVEPPYTVRISSLPTAPKEVRDHVELVKDDLVEARIYRKRHNGDDIDVSIVMASGGIEADDQAAEIRKAVEAVQYEGPDPKSRAGIEKLRQRLKLDPAAKIKVAVAGRSSAMMSLSFTMAPVNSLIGISGLQKGAVPDPPLPDGITATETCILVCYSEVIGGTKITLGQASDVNPGYAPAFDGQLATASRVVRVVAVDWKPVLETPVSAQLTRIRIWKNKVRFADKIIIGAE
jgi:hypothetical protein